eukprot:GHVU01073450.1.p2 GENE.GHVU01073450.1~~GHVU01073450.1.p2  ORF type:complete len:102 (+),score=11.40 GHVU01073450.1:124-429(+)
MRAEHCSATPLPSQQSAAETVAGQARRRFDQEEREGEVKVKAGSSEVGHQSTAELGDERSQPGAVAGARTRSRRRPSLFELPEPTGQPEHYRGVLPCYVAH